MNKSESKYYNTACLMDEALIALLEKKDFEFISVKEICSKAGVNRSTFYLHYETMGDLISEVLEYINKKFLSYFSQNEEEIRRKINDSPTDELIFITPDFLQPYLSFIKENKHIFRAAFANPDGMQAGVMYVRLKKNILLPILSRFNIPEDDREYYIEFYIQGTMAIIRKWIMNDCTESIEKIEKLITDCVRPKEHIK